MAKRAAACLVEAPPQADTRRTTPRTHATPARLMPSTLCSAGRESGSRELVAAAAAGLVLLERADDDRRSVGRRGSAVDEPLRHRRGTAAAVAYRLQLVDELGAAEQLRHHTEREASEVLVEAAGDDAH